MTTEQRRSVRRRPRQIVGQGVAAGAGGRRAQDQTAGRQPDPLDKADQAVALNRVVDPPRHR